MRLALAFAAAFISSPAFAQSYKQMQWGIDGAANPGAFGANHGGSMRVLGNLSNSGVWSLQPSDIRALPGSTSVVNLYTTPPSTGTFIGNSNIFSFYPTIGNDPGDHQRAQELIVFTPTQDATISETGLSVNAYMNTGYASAWPGAAQSVTLNTIIYDPTGHVWKATTAGTTGASQPVWPTNPTLGVTTQADGTVVWTAQSHNQTNAKMPVFVTATAGPNAGHVWALDTALVLNAGWHGGFANSVEFDFANNSGADCLSCQTVFITGLAGPNKIAAGISIYNGSSTNYAYQDAIVLGGNKLATQSDIRSFSQSPYMIYDIGTSRTWGINLAGSYSGGAILANDAIRAGFDFARLEFFPTQTGNNNAWRMISNVNGASTDGNFVIQHTTDKFVANFTSFIFGASGTFKPHVMAAASLPTCDASSAGSEAVISNGVTYANGAYGSVVGAAGGFHRKVLCTAANAGGTHAWTYN